jgi:hypothetical protein
VTSVYLTLLHPTSYAPRLPHLHPYPAPDRRAHGLVSGQPVPVDATVANSDSGLVEAVLATTPDAVNTPLVREGASWVAAMLGSWGACVLPDPSFCNYGLVYLLDSW